MDPVFDNGDNNRYDGFIVVNFSIWFSQKGGMQMSVVNNLSRLQGNVACDCLCTPLLEEL
jgi:hypothetical protein